MDWGWGIAKLLAGQATESCVVVQGSNLRTAAVGDASLSKNEEDERRGLSNHQNFEYNILTKNRRTLRGGWQFA